MKSDAAIRKRIHEVCSVQPTDLGFPRLTAWYKTLSHPLKTMPFILFVPVSGLMAAILYVVFGYLTVRLVTILQYGF